MARAITGSSGLRRGCRCLPFPTRARRRCHARPGDYPRLWWRAPTISQRVNEMPTRRQKLQVMDGWVDGRGASASDKRSEGRLWTRRQLARWMDGWIYGRRIELENKPPFLWNIYTCVERAI